MPQKDQPSLGVGEAAQGPTAAAIANAVFHASGRRLRRLPLSPERFLNSEA
jgi:CO/xanthine dehydrogenase Mo-binding subunit